MKEPVFFVYESNNEKFLEWRYENEENDENNRNSSHKYINVKQIVFEDGISNNEKQNIMMKNPNSICKGYNKLK